MPILSAIRHEATVKALKSNPKIGLFVEVDQDRLRISRRGPRALRPARSIWGDGALALMSLFRTSKQLLTNLFRYGSATSRRMALRRLGEKLGDKGLPRDQRMLTVSLQGDGQQLVELMDPTGREPELDQSHCTPGLFL